MRVYLACSSSLIGRGQQFGVPGAQHSGPFCSGLDRTSNPRPWPGSLAPPRLPLSFLRGWAAAHEHFVTRSKGRLAVSITPVLGPCSASSPATARMNKSDSLAEVEDIFGTASRESVVQRVRMCAKEVVADAPVSALLLTVRPQDARQFASGRQIIQLEGWRSQERESSNLSFRTTFGFSDLRHNSNGSAEAPEKDAFVVFVRMVCETGRR